MRNMYAWLAVAALTGLPGLAAAQTPLPRVVSGTITKVNGHLVTIQRSTGTIVVNDSPALAKRVTGNVAVGRAVAASGYWQDGTFYATSFADADVYAGMPSITGGPNMPLRVRGAVRGTITTVRGNLVTVSNGVASVVIDDTPALSNYTTGDVTLGRSIVAVGFWRGGTFYAAAIEDAHSSYAPQGMSDFGAFARVPASVAGTIAEVNGNSVLLAQAGGVVKIDDQPALNAQATGNVAVGRAVIATGYWLHGVFYATSFADAAP